MTEPRKEVVEALCVLLRDVVTVDDFDEDYLQEGGILRLSLNLEMRGFGRREPHRSWVAEDTEIRAALARLREEKP